MTFGEMIRTRRELRGLTQENVGDAVKTTPSTVGGWERDEHVPHPRHVRALAALFDADPAEFARPVRPAVARMLLSERRRALLVESPDLLVAEPDPFPWRLRQALEERDLDEWTLARRLGVADRTARRWLTGAAVPAWNELWRLAQLLDVPVWWWRCGGQDELDMYGPGGCTEEPPDERYGWTFAEQVAQRFGAPVEDIVRTAYPRWAGWRWRGRLDEWAPMPAPPCPLPARLRLAILDYCATGGGDVHDASQWLVDACGVSTTAVSRWLDGRRTPQWDDASRAALALGKPAWWLWLPPAEVAVVRERAA